MARKRDNRSADLAKTERLQTDPKLRMFLRQAGAIIAAERGLSKASRAKLQSLAVRLELSDEQFHAAINELQNTVQLPKTLNHWERSFVAFLQREWQELHGKVLSISVENRAIDLAARKYQISEVRAQQLIQKTAEELGIGRMAEGDAERFGQRLIADAVGRQGTLAPGQLEELQRVGERWGLSSEAVRQLVDQVLDDNQRMPTSRPGRQGILLLPAGMILLGLLSVLFWQLGWWPGSTATGDGQPEPPNEVVSVPNVDRPTWWNKELDGALAAIGNRKRDSSKYPIPSTDPDKRLEGMRELIELARESPPIHQFPDSERLEWNQLIALLYLYDPDPEVSRAVFQSLTDSFQMGAGNRPPKMESAFWAVQLLAVFMEFNESRESVLWSERMNQVRELARDVIGAYPDDMDSNGFFSLAHQRISVDLWQQVIEQIQSGAPLDAALIRRLKQQTASVLDPKIVYQLEMVLVRELLEKDEGQWETVKDSIASLVQGANSSQVADWIDRLSEIKDLQFRQFLATELVARSGIQVAPGNLEQSMERLSQYRSQRSRPDIEAWLEKNRQCVELAGRIEPWIDPDSIDRPQAIADVVYATNVSLALMIELEKRQDFGHLSRLLSAGFPHLDEISLSEGGPESSPHTHAAEPSPAERRMKDRSIERLMTAEPDRVAVRISALESLAKMAGKFEDLTYDNALVLATYFLADKELQESLAVERLLPQLSHWPSLHLALADLIRQSSGQDDRVLTVYRLLHGNVIGNPESSEWREVLSTSLVQFALGILESRDAPGITESDLDWERLQKIQRVMLITRARIIDQWLVSQAWGDQNYKAVLTRLAQYRVAPERRQRFDNALQIAAEAPPLAQWVLLNQLLIELISGELDQAEQALVVQRDQVVEQYRRRMKQDISLGRRLLLTEYALLRLASLSSQQKTFPWREE
ncbi:MAG: hypothetical protein MK108_02620 [Mariniblastus sp.]|nr:hypothetical protein [Mariniblastus sp.]